jgi:uncharacterized membrane protein
VLRWLRNRFLTGLVVAAPIGITVWLIYTFVAFVDRVIKPLIPDRYNPETYLPIGIPGMGVLIAVLGADAAGRAGGEFFGRTLIDIGERIVNGVPLIRNIYSALKQIVETVFQGQQNSFKEVVLVEYPMAGSYAVAFVASEGRGVIKPDRRPGRAGDRACSSPQRRTRPPASCCSSRAQKRLRWICRWRRPPS